MHLLPVRSEGDSKQLARPMRPPLQNVDRHKGPLNNSDYSAVRNSLGPRGAIPARRGPSIRPSGRDRGHRGSTAHAIATLATTYWRHGRMVGTRRLPLRARPCRRAAAYLRRCHEGALEEVRHAARRVDDLSRRALRRPTVAGHLGRATTAGPPVPMPMNSWARVFSLLTLGSPITSIASTLPSATCAPPSDCRQILRSSPCRTILTSEIRLLRSNSRIRSVRTNVRRNDRLNISARTKRPHEPLLTSDLLTAAGATTRKTKTP